MILSTIILLPHIWFIIASAKDKKLAYRQSLCALVPCLLCLYMLVVHDQSGFDRFNYCAFDYRTYALFFLGNGYLGTLYSCQLLADEMKDVSAIILGSVCIATVIIIIAAIISFAIKCKRESVHRAELFCPVICFIAIGIYHCFSVTFKNIVISPNYSWVLPFFCVTLAYALCSSRCLRYIFLLVILNAVPLTYSNILISRSMDKNVYNTMLSYMRPNDSVIISSINIVDRHYLRVLLPDKNVKDDVTAKSIVTDIQQQNTVLDIKAEELLSCLKRGLFSCYSKHMTLWIYFHGMDGDREQIKNSAMAWIANNNKRGVLSYQYYCPEEKYLLVRIVFNPSNAHTDF